MIWLTWRQHRGEILGAAIILAVLGVVLLLHGIPMHKAYVRDGIEACQLQMFTSDPGACASSALSFERTWTALPYQFASWLPFLPMVAGMLIGAPLLAREFEQGTWQLAWTQGVTRRRWLASKLALVLGGACLMSIVFAAGLTWWFGPLAPHPFTADKFNHTVVVFPAYVVVAVAIGVLVGVLVRRTIAAAAISAVAYLMVRIPIEFYLRPRYQQPLTTTDPAVSGQGFIVGQGDGPAPGSEPMEIATRYHPADRFWEFQLIESAILLIITMLLLAIAWRLVLGKRVSAPTAHRKQMPASA